jgi:hypothetical protein
MDGRNGGKSGISRGLPVPRTAAGGWAITGQPHHVADTTTVGSFAGRARVSTLLE